MPILARPPIREKPNFVDPPVLPIPITTGDISWSKSLEGSGLTLSINYEQVTIEEITTLENAYTPGLEANDPVRLTLFGIKYEVSAFTYERSKYIYRGGVERFDRYKVSVEMQWEYEKLISAPIKIFRTIRLGTTSITIEQLAAAAKVPYTGSSFKIKIPENSDKDFTLTLGDNVTKQARLLGCFVVYGRPGVELRPIDAVKIWNFADEDVITDGGNTLRGAIAYNRAEMTFSGDNESSSADIGDPPGVKLTKKAPVIETTYEQDSDNPAQPPANSTILKSIDSNSVDGQGPKLTKTTTTTQDGQTMRVIRDIYGFLYTAKDIHVGDGVLRATPGQFWTLIERQIEEHIYSSLPSLALNVKAKDPDPMYAKTSVSGEVNLIINPDYEEFVNGTALGDRVTFRSTAKYLTQIKTSGWAYRRLLKETEALETIDLDATDPTYKHYFFKKIPIIGATNYFLVSSDQKYGDGGQGIPFSVEWKSVEELTDEEKKRVSDSNTTEGGRVGILTPDLNYVQPLTAMFEGTSKNSFAWAPNPEFDAEDPATYNPLVTGEESYDCTWRIVVDNNHYRERQASFSASNADYANIAESIRVRYSTGRPPEGTSLKETWEVGEEKDNTVTVGNTTNKQYFVTTDLVGRTPEGGSVEGTSDAKDLAQAKLALATNLRIQGWQQGTQESKIISWYYPDIEPGDIIVVPSRRFQKYGALRVTGVSWDMKCDGYGNNPYRPNWTTTGGTKLTLGCDKPREFTVEVVEKPQSETGADGEPSISVEADGGQISLGIPILTGLNRRNF